MIKKVFAVMVILLVISSPALSQDDEHPASVKGKVLKVLDEYVESIDYSGGSLKAEMQILEVIVRQGKYSGKTFEAEHNIGGLGSYKSVRLEEGDNVLLYLEETPEGIVEKVYVTDFLRQNHLILLGAVFLVLMLAIGGFKGLKAVITLGVTIIAVIKIMLPLLLKGHNPVLLSIAVCIGAILITFAIISGFNTKTLSAIIGTSCGVTVAGLAALVVSNGAKLTGLGTQEAQMLNYIPQNVSFDFSGLLFAGIILGALGAVMDVGMSIASSMHEIKSGNPIINTKNLIQSGMNVGRDIMGTMSNTLILAYTGGALHLLLLLTAYGIPLQEFINGDYLASEVVRALAGSIGLITTIPFTALAAGIIENKRINVY